jgi:hypothetical protein
MMTAIEKDLWDYIEIGKSYGFDLEFLTKNDRRTSFTSGRVADKYYFAGDYWVILLCAEAINFENITRVVGPYCDKEVLSKFGYGESH